MTGTATLVANISGRPPRRRARPMMATTQTRLTSAMATCRAPAAGSAGREGQQPEEQRARVVGVLAGYGRVSRGPRAEQRRSGAEDVEGVGRDERVVGQRDPAGRDDLDRRDEDRQRGEQAKRDDQSVIRAQPDYDRVLRRSTESATPASSTISAAERDDPPDAPGQRLVAELHAVATGRQRRAAQQVVDAMQVGRLAVERHLPAGVVHVGEHELAPCARPSRRPPRARARR